jgi:glycosyltransferase involved in cell wall biosynthesis
VTVAATAVRASAELMADGETGHVGRRGDSVAFADALERLLPDPMRHARFGRAARLRELERFSPHQVHQVRALWDKVLEPRSS